MSCHCPDSKPSKIVLFKAIIKATLLSRFQKKTRHFCCCCFCCLFVLFIYIRLSMCWIKKFKHESKSLNTEPYSQNQGRLHVHLLLWHKETLMVSSLNRLKLFSEISFGEKDRTLLYKIMNFTWKYFKILQLWPEADFKLGTCAERKVTDIFMLNYYAKEYVMEGVGWKCQSYPWGWVRGLQWHLLRRY